MKWRQSGKAQTCSFASIRGPSVLRAPRVLRGEIALRLRAKHQGSGQLWSFFALARAAIAPKPVKGMLCLFPSAPEREVTIDGQTI
jgi:hypothetical protein